MLVTGVSFRKIGTGNFCLYFKGFNGTDIYHSDVKMRYVKFQFFFYSLKIIFQNFQKRPNAW